MLKFQTDDSRVPQLLRATDGTGDKVLTIPALSSNANMLTSESSIAGDKVNINGATAEASPLNDSQTNFYFMTQAEVRIKKVTGANLKTYVSAGSGVPSGTNGQVIVFNACNVIQATAVQE